MKSVHIRVFIPLIAWLFGCCGDRPGMLGEELVASEDVPVFVTERALRLIEDSAYSRLIREDGRRIEYIVTEVERRKADPGEGSAEATYRVIHYRYDDDTAIHIVVDLEQNTVVSSETKPHFPTPFTRKELEEARGLAMENNMVRDALSVYVDQVVVEGLPIRAPDENDPWFGRRAISLLFKIHQDYLSGLEVVVDLTNREVFVTTTDDAP